MAYTTNNLFNSRFKKTTDLIIDDNTRLVTVKVRLNQRDIINLNLNDTIYIDGQFFIVNKIRDYNANKPQLTTVELILTPQTVNNPSLS